MGSNNIAKNKALFLDRDGVINVDYGYVYQIEKFDFMDGIFDFCLKAQEKGYKIIVITNQSGIERKYFTEKDFEKLNNYMINEFRKRGIEIMDVFYCPSADDKNEDRKPNSGMFLKAKNKYNIDMSKSISVGDKERDIEASRKAGVIKNFLFDNNFDKLMEEL